MEKIFIVLILVFGIIGLVSSFFSREKINTYIKEQGGVLISTTSPFLKYNYRNKSILIK